MSIHRVLTRRRFLTTSAASLGGLPLLTLDHRVSAAQPDALAKPVNASPLTIGLIADLHHGNLTPDADARLDVFLQAVADRGEVDLLIQLGDFCHPRDDARGLCNRFNSFEGPKLHVLGNHDMDLGTKEQVMDLWGMPARYGSVDIGGYHFITLDRNNLKRDGGFEPYANANFYIDRTARAWVDDEQLEWLTADLTATNLPTIVLTHQPLGIAEGKAGAASPQVAPVTRILETANANAGWAKVQAAFCGHNHTDRALTHTGIHYIHFNSASYRWIREPVRYEEALFAFVTLNPTGWLTVEGRTTTWAEPTPKQQSGRRDFPDPAITDRELPLAQLTESIDGQRLRAR